MYTSTVMFYPNETTTDFDKLNLLKQSLSQVLPHLYPMAGCLIDNLFVDCNDKGAVFHEARVNCHLSEFLQDLVPGELTKLIPFEVHGDAEEFLTGIQFNVFQCGGIGLGVCVSHSNGDAVSLFSFLKSWAAVCRGEREFDLPDFKLSSLFPAKQKIDKRIEMMTEPDIVAKIFVFSDAAITNMKEKYSDQNLNHPPSRVGALSAFIWSRLVAADSQLDLKSKKIYMMGHAVNMRPRIDPPLTQTSFGNCVWCTSAFPGSENEIVSCFNDSVNKIDNDFIKELQEGILDKSEEHSSGAELVGFYFTSLCRFPIYEADFGWNQPVRVCLMPARFRNCIPLLDTKSGDGIEAYVNLKRDCLC